MFPEKKLHGFDLTSSAVKIAGILRDEYHMNIVEAHQFDFTKPDRSVRLEKDSAVYTFSALEQIGKRYEAFVDFLLAEKPKIVIHLEPINELYDENNLVDWIAKEFHEQRHYLDGYYNYLKSLEADDRIEIVFMRRTQAGGWNHESNSIIVWRPL